jgi:predicted SAM-dependent methyltransferase
MRNTLKKLILSTIPPIQRLQRNRNDLQARVAELEAENAELRSRPTSESGNHAPVTREDIIRSHFDTSGLSLEIGPSYNPLLPKSAGYRVETADHADKAHLVEKYRNERNIDWRNIEEVDFVIADGNLLNAVPHRQRYDTIIASNVAEHTPDLVAFLNDCAELLKPTGQLVLINPDKRYCFDFFRSVTSTREVLQAHLEKRTRHSPATLFDHVLYFSERNKVHGWSPHDVGEMSFVNNMPTAIRNFERWLSTEEYIDCHSWVFTPSSFRLIVQDLGEMGLIKLHEASFFPSIGGYEFLVSLSQNGKGCAEPRLDLCRSIIREQAEVLDRL